MQVENKIYLVFYFFIILDEILPVYSGYKLNAIFLLKVN